MKVRDKELTTEDIEGMIDWQAVEKQLDYWKNKTQWIDSELKLQEECTEEEYYKQQDSIREIMELNMVLYGRW